MQTQKSKRMLDQPVAVAKHVNCRCSVTCSVKIVSFKKWQKDNHDNEKKSERYKKGLRCEE